MTAPRGRPGKVKQRPQAPHSRPVRVAPVNGVCHPERMRGILLGNVWNAAGKDSLAPLGMTVTTAIGITPGLSSHRKARQ